MGRAPKPNLCRTCKAPLWSAEQVSTFVASMRKSVQQDVEAQQQRIGSDLSRQVEYRFAALSGYSALALVQSWLAGACNNCHDKTALGLRTLDPEVPTASGEVA